ncbi:MAG: amino acid adenylation domain-containing protein [Clostridia bacterium]|nr:amino acid adenylation domain-containing protein [Clostridia bacterium]
MRIKNVLQYLEHTAARLPDKIAFSDGSGGASMSFAALLDTARRVGSTLCRAGMTGKRVAVLMDRHPAAIAAMLGATYAGAVYVPLDATMPKERICYILESCRAGMIVCDECNRALAESFDRLTMTYEALTSQPTDDISLRRVRARQIDTDPMYIIFTSGSTGEPKGVVGCHRAVIDYGEALTSALSLDEQSVFGCQSPLYFDAPLKEILTTLMMGATTYLIPRGLFSFPLPLIDYLIKNGINTICWVSSVLTNVSALGALDVRAPHTLKTVVFGSEALPICHYHAWRKALPEATFYQLYGPTEATGMSCVWRADRELSENERIPIGAPLDNTGLMLIDEQGNEIFPLIDQASEIGEMYLRGSCLTLGYDHKVDQTEAAFVQNPLQDAYPEQVYRTGDLAYYNAHGELVFVGRRDGQIKRMGHRIELGEIEQCAQRSPSVTQAACVVNRATQEIILFYSGSAQEHEVMAALNCYLPRYYLPARAVKRSALPVTPNGKIDRKTLSKE